MTDIAEKDFIYGLMYGLIKDAPQNYDEIMKSVDNERSMEKLVNAHYNLAVMYHKGIGVPKNYEEAGKSYAVAEREGYAKAKNNMGVMFHKGQTINENHGLAFNLYREAAGKGAVLAQYNLGIMYYYDSKKKKDLEIIHDLTQAYIWVSMAVTSGLYIGNRLLEHIEIETEMTSTDIAIAQRNAVEYWKANHEKWEE